MKKKPRKRKPYLGKHPKPKPLYKVPSLAGRYNFFNGIGWANNLGADISCSDSKYGSNNPDWEKGRATSDVGSAYSRVYMWKKLQSDQVKMAWSEWQSPNHALGTYKYRLVGHYPMAMIDRTFGTNAAGVVLAKSQAKLAFLGKVNEAIAPFTGGVFFGEIRQTIRMIRSPLKKLVSYTRGYHKKVERLARAAKKRVRVHKFRKFYDDESFISGLTSAYLEWTYGVLPILSDMDGLGKAIGQIKTKRTADIRLQVTIPIPEITVYQGLHRVGVSSWNAPVMAHLVDRLQGSVRIVGAIDTTLLSGSIPSNTGLEALGLSMNQFVPTVWNLIPYSFVSDYVVNIGQVLGAAFTATQYLKYCWETTRLKQLNTSMCVAVPGMTRPISASGFGVAAIEGISLNRVKPSLSVNILDIHFQDFTAKHAVNTAVLALDKFRGLKDLR